MSDNRVHVLFAEYGKGLREYLTLLLRVWQSEGKR